MSDPPDLQPRPVPLHLAFPTLEVANAFQPVGTIAIGRRLGRQDWKHISVVASIALSIAALGVSACAGLQREDSQMLRALNITGIVINAVSVSLSALTSLDWKTESQNTADTQRRLHSLARTQKDADGRVLHVLTLDPDVLLRQ